jgi:hypothetical protein
VAWDGPMSGCCGLSAWDCKDRIKREMGLKIVPGLLTQNRFRKRVHKETIIR